MEGQAGRLENVLLILKELKAKSIQEKGNLFYQVHQDNSDPNRLILFEEYSDDSALTLRRSFADGLYSIQDYR